MKKAWMGVLALGPAAAIACGGSVAGSEIDPYVSASSSSSSSTSGNASSSGSTSGYSSSSSSGTPSLKEPKVHRAGATACDTTRADYPVSVPDAGIGGGYVQCTSHSQCTERKNGRCTGNVHDGWRCDYDLCLADADCGKGSVCECEGGFRSDNNVCLSQSGCQVDADCGAGSWCSPTLGSCGHYSKAESYQCHTAADECTDDTDCTENGSGPFGGQAYCAFDRTIGHWKCSNSECAG